MVVLIFIPFTAYQRTSFTEQAGQSYTNGFSGLSRNGPLHTIPGSTSDMGSSKIQEFFSGQCPYSIKQQRKQKRLNRQTTAETEMSQSCFHPTL